jgi:hypothetical protein
VRELRTWRFVFEPWDHARYYVSIFPLTHFLHRSPPSTVIERDLSYDCFMLLLQCHHSSGRSQTMQSLSVSVFLRVFSSVIPLSDASTSTRFVHQNRNLLREFTLSNNPNQPFQSVSLGSPKNAKPAPGKSPTKTTVFPTLQQPP